MSRLSKEELDMFAALKEDKDEIFATAVVGCYTRAYSDGYKKGRLVGEEWAKSGFSTWWYLPSLTISLLVGTLLGCTVMWAALTPVAGN